MRFLALIIVSIFLLAGCGATSATDEIPKKPRIPSPELKASVLDYDRTDIEKLEIEEMERLLDEIEKDLTRPNITEEDIRRGWYYGSFDDKKYGTPDSWIWSDEGDKSRWISPNALEEDELSEDEELCNQTAGQYLISCIDTESADCDYVPKTECRCIDNSKWKEGQGCIMVDEEGGFVSVSGEELKQGWYKGLPNEKKLNTPTAWIWVEAGQNSRWQNPAPK